MSFEGKVAIVTGASRGIGRSIAIALAGQGATVACLATTEQGAARTAAEIESAGGTAKGFACDISSAEAVDAAIERIGTELGTPAVLINNAGINRDTLLMRMKEEDWDAVVDVNLKGAFLCIKAVSRSMMKARYGRIVNISSIIGQVGAAGQSNYAAAKAGLFGLTMSVAKELGSRGITCNAIAPGYVMTDMTENLPEEMKEQVIKRAPVGRLGTPEDIVPAVLFLASEESRYITGQTLTVDGGLTL
jgi:3-oxoacyl-[acyl-carrier protein] reductase